MSKKNLFEYRDYKKYLVDIIDNMENHGRGERSKIATALRCHLAYVSQVLNGEAQLSSEQADILNQYLAHTSAESDFFLLLVQMERAGTKSLRAHYSNKIEEIVTERHLLKNRLQFQKELPPDIQPIYYSAWYYTAIHFMLAIPELQSKEALCKYTGLPISIVTKVLEFLVSAGLAEQKGLKYQIGTSRIHLGSDSPLISKHHTNWRLQALQSIERVSHEDLHYSSVIVLDKKSVSLIKAALVKAIEEIRSLMTPSSKYEALYCYAIDLFEVGSTATKVLETTVINKKRNPYEKNHVTHSS